MKYKIGQKVKYFADDTEEWFDGVITDYNPMRVEYCVEIYGGHYHLAESLLVYPHETEGSDLKISNLVGLR